MKLLFIVLTAFGMQLVATGQAAREYEVSGIVRALLGPQEVVVAHENIPEFMPAMTMSFILVEGETTEGIAVNDRIRGTLIVDQEGMRLGKVQVTGKAGEIGNPPGPTPAATRLDKGSTVPEFDLVDQDDNPHGIVAKDRYTLLTFIFTRCPVPEFCPLMSSRMASIQGVILEENWNSSLRLLSVTIDPEFDTPPQLSLYAESLGADDSIWTHARATPDETDRIVRAFRVYRERNGALLDHTLCTALIDPSGKVVEIWRGNGWSTDEVLETFRSTLASANQDHGAQSPQ